MAIINKSTKNKWWWGCGERGTLLHSWWECRLVQTLWKAVWRYLKKSKNGSAFWTSDPTSGNISERTQNTNLKEHKHLYVHCGIIYSHQDMEVAHMSTADEWIKQLLDIYTTEYYSAINKKKVLPFVTVWMGLENIMLGKISQSDKDQYHLISLICGI